jgi:hypothetical protein
VATTQTPPHVEIPQEEDIRVTKKLRGNYKLLWAGGLGFIFIIVMIVSAVAGVPLYGLAFGSLEAMYFIFFIFIQPLEHGHTTLLANTFRHGTKLYRRTRGHLVHISEQPTLGETIRPRDSPDQEPPPKPIKMIGRISFVEYKENVLEEEDQRPIGIARDHRLGTISGSLWVASQSLLSADNDSKEDRRGAWASILESLAEGGLLGRYLAWSDQTWYGQDLQTELLVRLLRERIGLVREHPPNQDVLLQRAPEMGLNSWQHDTHLHLSIYPPQLKREIRMAGGAPALLVEQLDDLYSQLLPPGGRSPLGVRTASILDINELIMLNRARLDPVFAQPYVQAWDGLDEDMRLSEYFAWSGMADFRSDDFVIIGNTFHMGFYIDQFTRRGMKPEQLWEILKVKVPKTVTTVFEMPPPHRSQRRAEYSTTGARARSSSRGAPTASEQVAAERAAQREKDMAEHKGHDGRVRVYIDVTGSSLEEVRAHVETMRKAWMSARFAVEPLTRRQFLGIHAVMPLTRGLATMPVPRWW